MGGKVFKTDVDIAGAISQNGVTIVDASGNIDAPVTTTNLSTTGNTTLGDTAADTLTVSGKTVIGTSSANITIDTADTKFFQMYTDCGATSGDSRGIYCRHAITGAGAGGESLRALTKLEAAGTTARGTQISLDIASTGSVSGLGAGVDAQIALPNAALAANGTYAVNNFEVYAGGTSTAISAVTGFSFNRFVLGGNATGAAAVEDSINLIEVTGGTNDTGNMVGLAGNEPSWTGKTILVRGKLNGVVGGFVFVAN